MTRFRTNWGAIKHGVVAGLFLAMVTLPPLTMASEAAVAVTKIIPSSIPFFSDHKASEVAGEIVREDVVLPARQFGNPSEMGLIHVRFHFVRDDREPINAWINSGDVETDQNITLDIDDCSENDVAQNTVDRGSRALGGGGC